MRLCITFLSIIAVAHGQRAIDPPEFSGEPKKPRNPPTDLQLAFFKDMGNFENTKTAEVMPKVSAFLEAHPDFSDGYMIRVLGQYCELKQPASAAMLADVDKAIQTYSPKAVFGKPPELYGLKARLEYDLGRYQAAMDDVERGLKLSPSDAGEVLKASGVKPESRAESEQLCSWTLTELDGFAKRFPRDYRVPLYRGIYLSKLALYEETLAGRAIGEFEKALTLNPKSAIAHYFIGRVYSRVAIFSSASIASKDIREANRRKAANEYTIASGLDRTFKEAFAERANSYLSLDQYLAAIRDFDKVIELDPKDAGAFHDRAIAWNELGNPLRAIFDYDSALRLDTLSDESVASAHENRGDLQLKMGRYKEAVQDFSAVIRLRLDSISLLMTLRQFRALYPEYGSLSDAVFVAKIRDMFWPQYEMDKFAESLLRENKDYNTFLLPEAFIKRADAYLGEGQFRRAVADYNRAVASSDNGGEFIERWRSIGKSGNAEQFVDIKTLEFAPIAKVWLKTTKAKGYALDSFELDCRARKLREQSSLTYNDDGKVTDSVPGPGAWQAIVPDTLGENLYDGMCRAD